MSGITLSPELLSTLWNSRDAVSSLFNQNGDNSNQPNAQPEAATATAAPTQSATPAAAQQTTPPAQSQAPDTNFSDQGDGKDHDSFWGRIWNGPGESKGPGWTLPAPKDNNGPGIDWGRVGRYVKNDFLNGPDAAGKADQPSAGQPGAPQPTVAGVNAPKPMLGSSPAAGGTSTPPLDSFGQAAAASRPTVPTQQAQAAPVAPDIQTPVPSGDNPLASLFGQQAPSGPPQGQKGAIDWGKSDNNINLESGKNAPIPSRPVVPYTRDVNPATNQPFNTKDWNAFSKPSEGAPFGRRPDDGRPFVSAAEQQAYAKNNNIDLNSFANQHHTLQSLLGMGLSVVGDAATRMAGGPAGYSEAIRQSPAQSLIASNETARQYDANRPAAQAQANFSRLQANLGMAKQEAQTESELATAKQKEAQTAAFAQFNLSGAKDAFGNPLSGGELFSYIQKNNPGLAADLQAYRQGDKNPSDLSTRPGLNNPESRQRFSQLARSIWPDFSENQYNVRQGVQKSFTSGEDASTIGSLNTAVNHIKMFNDLATAQKNGDTQGVNRIVNWVQNQLGHPEANNAATAATALSGELANIFKKSGATDQEIAGIRGNLDPAAMSPDQIAGWTKTAEGLMAGRMNSLNNKWQNQFVQDDDRRKQPYAGMLSDSSKQVLAGLPGGQALLQEAGGQPAAQGNQPAAPAANNAAPKEQPVYVNGKLTGYTTDGKTYSRKVQ